MKAYALTWDAGFRNLMVATCPDLDDAKKAIDGARSDGGIAAGADVDLNLNGPSLVSLHNALIALAGIDVPNVNRFTTRQDGQRRVFALLESNFKTAPEAAAPPKVDVPAATSETTTNEDDMATKGKKAKKTKAVKVAKVKKVRTPKAPREKKVRQYKAAVVSKGGEKAKASALEMIERKNGATAQEIADKLELSLGSAKNLVWYLRRDGKKIVVNKDSERKPYVIL